jgi:hypothetical protein
MERLSFSRGRRDRADAAEREAQSEHASRGQSLVEFAIVLPVALLLLVAVADMARLYTTMLTVESAAREAADFGAYGSPNWDEVNQSNTLAAMEARACVASRHLDGYVGSGATCSNPTVAITLLEPGSIPADASSGCEDPARPGGPCEVQVDLDYTFDLIMPLALEVGGHRFGLPENLSFRRTAVFANSDFVAAPW